MGRYVFDQDNLRYEKIDKDLKSKFLRIFSWVGSSLILGLLIIVLYSFIFDTPRERQLRQENAALMEDYKYLNQKYSRVDTVLKEVQNIDEDIYRTIFETEPVNDSNINQSGFNNYMRLINLKSQDIVVNTKSGLDKVFSDVRLNESEYMFLREMVSSRAEGLRSIPAIQPIQNQDLSRMASGFGNRLHPFYKIVKHHDGMDFTAPTGTEVYATADGVIEGIERTRRGKGNMIVIDHRNGYESVYAHLDDFKVRRGQNVTRGDVIGTVGNTGLSVAPHLHYEVRLNGKTVNPVNYFFLELSPEQYNKLIELSINSGQSFD
jgi:murein DD-endopeptidase MepM/ murein hydrolase activator NlpD